MTPFEADYVNQQQIERSEAARCDWEMMGATAATAHDLPQYANDAYLAGYLWATKQLPCNPDGTIERPPVASIQPMFEYGAQGEVWRGVDPWHDCDWAYPDDD